MPERYIAFDVETPNAANDRMSAIGVAVVEGGAVVDYACTCRMGRRCFPELENHRLDTLCTYLDIPLDHHRAGSDSRACGELLLRCLDHGADIERFRRHYDLLRARTIS